MAFPDFKVKHDKVVDIVKSGATKNENTGDWNDGEVILVADLNCSIQELSGREMATQSGTEFESSHVLIADPVSVEIPQGVEVREKAGEVILKKYKVVLPLPCESHLELEMKKI